MINYEWQTAGVAQKVEQRTVRQRTTFRMVKLPPFGTWARRFEGLQNENKTVPLKRYES